MPPTGRRRHRREQFWRTTVAAWRTSSQTAEAFCATRDISTASLFAWQRRLKALESAPAATFVPVRVVADALVEVVLTSGVVVRVPMAADPVAVARLVAALGAA